MESSKYRLLDLDAWSDGQIKSKMWLCQILESNWEKMDASPHVWIYGSWYGTLAQFLLIRDRFKIDKFTLFDVDQEALEVSRRLLSSWSFNSNTQIQFELTDCNQISSQTISQAKPGLIINTSCEHFESYTWFENIPEGTCFLAQSTNMKHPTHILTSSSLNEFESHLANSPKIFFKGELPFRYPNFSFDRYMILGQK